MPTILILHRSNSVVKAVHLQILAKCFKQGLRLITSIDSDLEKGTIMPTWMCNALQRTDIQNGFCKQYWMGGLTCGDLSSAADIDATLKIGMLTIAMLTIAMLTIAMLTKPPSSLSWFTAIATWVAEGQDCWNSFSPCHTGDRFQ